MVCLEFWLLLRQQLYHACTHRTFDVIQLNMCFVLFNIIVNFLSWMILGVFGFKFKMSFLFFYWNLCERKSGAQYKKKRKIILNLKPNPINAECFLWKGSHAINWLFYLIIKERDCFCARTMESWRKCMCLGFGVMGLVTTLKLLHLFFVGIEFYLIFV